MHWTQLPRFQEVSAFLLEENMGKLRTSGQRRGAGAVTACSWARVAWKAAIGPGALCED